LIRQALERFNAYTPQDLLDMVATLANSSDYKCVGALANVDEFRDYRSVLADPFLPLSGIKKLDIGEIVFRKEIMEEMRICRVFYREVGSSVLKEVNVVSQGRSALERATVHERFPDGSVITPVIPRSIFTYDHWAQLMEILDRCVGVDDSATEYFAAIPHCPCAASSKRKRRHDGDASAEISLSGSAPTTVNSPTSPSQDVSLASEPTDVRAKVARTSEETSRVHLIIDPDGYVPRFLRDLPTEPR